jgi:hypothetical protein
VLTLVICRPVEGGDQDEFRRLLPGETAALRDLKAKGTLVDAWSPGRPGAVLTLDVPGPDQAARIVADFPLVQAGQITTEIIPCTPSTCDHPPGGSPAEDAAPGCRALECLTTCAGCCPGRVLLSQSPR